MFEDASEPVNMFAAKVGDSTPDEAHWSVPDCIEPDMEDRLRAGETCFLFPSGVNPWTDPEWHTWARVMEDNTPSKCAREPPRPRSARLHDDSEENFLSQKGVTEVSRSSESTALCIRSPLETR